MEVWFRSFSFLFMGDGCRFQPLIFQGVLESGQLKDTPQFVSTNQVGPHIKLNELNEAPPYFKCNPEIISWRGLRFGERENYIFSFCLFVFFGKNPENLWGVVTSYDFCRMDPSKIVISLKHLQN